MVTPFLLSWPLQVSRGQTCGQALRAQGAGGGGVGNKRTWTEGAPRGDIIASGGGALNMEVGG